MYTRFLKPNSCREKTKLVLCS